MQASKQSDYVLTTEAWRWGPIREDGVDVTIALVVSRRVPTERTLRAYFHGHLQQINGGFRSPFTTAHAIELLDAEPAAGAELILLDARFVLAACPLEQTHARRYEEAARARIEHDLRLASYEGMQDWPLEVADATRIDEFCAYYDAAADDDMRFDVMSLIAFSMDDHLRGAGSHPRLDWFEATLTRDFALNGNRIAYWARLDAGDDPEQMFAVTPVMRRVWHRSLVPLALDGASAQSFRTP